MKCIDTAYYYSPQYSYNNNDTFPPDVPSLYLTYTMKRLSLV